MEESEFLHDLKEILNLANRFRLTAVVDDDFPVMRDTFDLTLQRLRSKYELV